MLLKLLLHIHYLGDFLIKERHPRPEVINYALTDGLVPTKYLYLFTYHIFYRCNAITTYLTFFNQ